jgi:hypothetical protein
LSGSGASLSSDSGTRIIGIIGILLGVFTIVALVSFSFLVATTARPTPENMLELSEFNANQDTYAFFAVGVTLFSTFLIALAGGFSGIVRKRSPSVSSAAALLVATGALTFAIDWDLEVGSLFAISQAPSTATYATDATYFAAVVSNFTSILSEADWLLIGIGLLLFAWAIWNGEIFPKWLSYVLLIGGVLGVLEALPLGIPFDIVSAILVGVWGFGAGRVLLRTKSMMAEPAK